MTNTELYVYTYGVVSWLGEKAKAKQEEDMFQVFYRLVMLGEVIRTYSLTKFFTASLVAGAVGVVVVIMVMTSIYNKRAEQLKRSGIGEIDRWKEFSLNNILVTYIDHKDTMQK